MGDPRRELAEQTALLDESRRALAALYRDIQAEAVADAYRDLVETSPVRTGAYRAEHVIEEGDGNILYEAPGRVGPDAIVNPPTFIDAPTVQGRVEPVGNYSTVQIVNRRFYAAALEYGSATNEPRYIYEQAGLRAEQNVAEIVERASRRKIG